jgi:hypothetical protein
MCTDAVRTSRTCLYSCARAAQFTHSVRLSFGRSSVGCGANREGCQGRGKRTHPSTFVPPASLPSVWIDNQREDILLIAEFEPRLVVESDRERRVARSVRRNVFAVEEHRRLAECAVEVQPDGGAAGFPRAGEPEVLAVPAVKARDVAVARAAVWAQHLAHAISDKGVMWR